MAKDHLTDENKEFIKELLDKSNYASILLSSDEEYDQQDLVRKDLTNTDLVGENTRTEYNLPFDQATIKIEPTFDVVPKVEIDLQTIDLTISVANENGDDDVVYVKHIPPPPETPLQLVHPCDKYRQKVKQLQKKKEQHRKRTKKEQFKH